MSTETSTEHEKEILQEQIQEESVSDLMRRVQNLEEEIQLVAGLRKRIGVFQSRNNIVNSGDVVAFLPPKFRSQTPGRP